MPWDPGGICHCGLRASRILRGPECHVRPPNVLGLVILGAGLHVMGLVHETDEAYKERKQLLAGASKK
jgi:hypothetical protein